MKPDFVIISSRVNKIFKERFAQISFGEAAEYISFFPSIEKKVSGIFADYGLELQYRGKTKTVFPANTLWGKEIDSSEQRITKNGEITIIETDSNKEIGSLNLTFSYDPELKLTKEPKILVKRFF